MSAVPEPDAYLTPEDIRQLDSEYTPIPAFEEWRSARVDADVWARHLAGFTSANEHATNESRARAVEIAIRAAAVDTGAIEGLYSTTIGLTITVAMRGSQWEELLGEGEPQREAFFQAQLEAYALVQSMAASTTPLNEAWLRELHRQLSSPQEFYKALTPIGFQLVRLPKGEYKKYPNHVIQPGGIKHAYAPVLRTQDEMQRLLAELRSSDFEGAHPVLQAAYAHYAVVAIHPFADGNGRVARALASYFLFRSVGIPLLVFFDRRDEYFSGLRAADKGDYQAFVDFIFDRATWALGFVSDNVSESPEVEAAALREVLRAHGPLSYDELDTLGYRLLQEFQAQFMQAANKLPLPPGVSLGYGSEAPQIPPDDRFRLPLKAGSPMSRFLFQSNPPASARHDLGVAVFVAKNKEARYPVALRVVVNGSEELLIQLNDVHPQETEDFKFRLQAWIRRLLAGALRELRIKSSEALRSSGY